MGRFQFWRIGKFNKHRRSHLLIDEQPNLLEILKLTEGSLTEFLANLPLKDNGKHYFDLLEEPVKEVITILSSGQEPRSIIQPESVSSFYFDSYFHTVWTDFSIGKPDIMEIPTALECLYKSGDIFVKKNLNNQPEISTGYYSYINWSYFDRIIVLDGTGDISQLYPPKFFQKVYVPQFHRYEHLTIHACNVFIPN